MAIRCYLAEIFEKNKKRIRSIEILKSSFDLPQEKQSSFVRLPGHIAAKRFFCEKITGGLIGSGPAAAAHPLKFTGAALAFELVIIAQSRKDFGMLPDIGKGALSDVAAICIQKSARLNVSAVGDEAKTDTAQTTPCYGIQAMGFKRDRFALFFSPLSEDTIVVRGTGGLEVQRCFVPLVIKPV